MKCPHCGAEITANSKFCESCGSQISYEMQREQEQLNKQGCPKCGSSNVQFKRENQGEIRGKKSKRVIYNTVGFCKDCGHTWYPETGSMAPKKNNMLWWVLGWIFFYPAPLMVLIWRKKNTWDIKVKIGVTVAFWALILGFYVVAIVSNKSDTGTTENTVESVSIEQESDTNGYGATGDNTNNDSESKTSVDESNAENVLNEESVSSKFDIHELPVMNGTKTERIGTYSMCYLLSADCTEETLAEWYAEIKDKGYNWSIIRYADYTGDENTGVYADNGLIEKGVHLDEDGSILSSGDTVYFVNEDGSLSLVN